ncbi:peptidoglycan DD-metalloendopeptidase family protein [Patulibacter brassicae]|uniref:Peptidoglycan DD-metalloendopeptidase family protein n=1 Tax=Patulibacter brassicae TaxID=1705717 RepID=A0ABU4VPM3_9ACTN|nr:peptidoglycan DD-metalloendopeptidase family protein [Patulibacter brassicae]MDX8153390.1 peptidoglycan DD-metalloendopeptidase family protein [Patulibacter brassicae]
MRLTRRELRSVQRRVGVRADGVLGARTRKALRRFQQRKRLAKTGVPNVETLRALDLPFVARVEAELRAAQVDGSGSRFPLQGGWTFGGAGTGFGTRGGAHEGIDLLADCGVPVVAVSSGTVKRVANHEKAGNYVVVTGTSTRTDQVYSHLQERPALRAGDRLQAGAPIGRVGDTGNATACLLHFELWTAPGWYEGGVPRDPRPDLEAWAAG